MQMFFSERFALELHSSAPYTRLKMGGIWKLKSAWPRKTRVWSLGPLIPKRHLTKSLTPTIRD